MMWTPKDGGATTWSESAEIGPFKLAVFGIGKLGPFGKCEERPQWVVMQDASEIGRSDYQVVARGHTWGDMDLARRNAVSGALSVLREYKRKTEKGSDAREALKGLMAEISDVLDQQPLSNPE